MKHINIFICYCGCCLLLTVVGVDTYSILEEYKAHIVVIQWATLTFSTKAVHCHALCDPIKIQF